MENIQDYQIENPWLYDEICYFVEAQGAKVGLKEEYIKVVAKRSEDINKKLTKVGEEIINVLIDRRLGEKSEYSEEDIEKLKNTHSNLAKQKEYIDSLLKELNPIITKKEENSIRREDSMKIDKVELENLY